MNQEQHAYHLGGLEGNLGMAIERAGAGQTGAGDEPEELVAGIHHPMRSAGQGALRRRPRTKSVSG